MDFGSILSSLGGTLQQGSSQDPGFQNIPEGNPRPVNRLGYMGEQQQGSLASLLRLLPRFDTSIWERMQPPQQQGPNQNWLGGGY